MTRYAGRALRLALCTLALTGCRHKTAPPVVPVPPPTTVPVAKPPDTAGIVPTLPMIPAPLTPVKLPSKRVVKKRKAPVALAALPEPAAPVPAAAAPAGAEVIGALTPGGDASSAQYQQARAMIGELDKQLSGLAASLQQSQHDQIARIVHFSQEAQRALKGGDAEGAVTLATKAKLLLDDLTK